MKNFDPVTFALEVFAQLTLRELSVLSWHAQGKTLEEIGAEFKVSRERVRQIEAKAQDRIQDVYNVITGS